VQPREVPSSTRDEFDQRFEQPRLWFSVYALGSVFLAGLIIFAYTFYKIVDDGHFDRVIDFIFKHPAVSIGIPTSMISAMVIVLLMRTVAGPIELEALGVKFKGASGPIIMWILCFGTFAAGIKLLWSLE
jgi:hypothetical protein